MNRISVVALGLVCSALILGPGCSKKGSDPGKKGGAAKSNHARLQGVWKIDFERMKTTQADLKKMSPGDLKSLKLMLSQLKYRFTQDKLFSEGGRKVEPKSYKVISDEGNTLVMESKERSGVVTKVTAVFHSDTSMTLTASGPGGEKDVITLQR